MKVNLPCHTAPVHYLRLANSVGQRHSPRQRALPICWFVDMEDEAGVIQASGRKPAWVIASVCQYNGKWEMISFGLTFIFLFCYLLKTFKLSFSYENLVILKKTDYEIQNSTRMEVLSHIRANTTARVYSVCVLISTRAGKPHKEQKEAVLLFAGFQLVLLF